MATEDFNFNQDLHGDNKDNDDDDDDYTYYDYNGGGDDGGDGDAYFRNLPPGYRFQPTCEELTEFYLEKKLLNTELPRHRIFDVNIYHHHPKTLSETFERIREDGWYFFTPRSKKYKNGTRPDRATPGGFWRQTGAAKSMPSKDNQMWIKNSLDFYDGDHRSPKKSEWKMHEYIPGKRNGCNNSNRTADGTERLDEFVLCRIYVNNSLVSKSKNGDGEGEASGSSLDKPAPPVSVPSDHNNTFSTPVMTDEHKLNSTAPAHQIKDPMNNDQSMFLSSMQPDAMMNQLVQPYMNADFLTDTFPANISAQLDEEDAKMWLDDKPPKGE